jgi:hypothetical protein
MMIDKRGMIAFVSAALATTCDAFSVGVTPSVMQHKGLPFLRQQKPLRAFASDRGENSPQNDHFAVSSDPSSASTLTQESTTTPIAPPPMARPAEDNKLAMVDKTASGVPAAAPPAAVEDEGQPVERKQSVWERNKAADVQGGSLRTWSFADQHKIDMIQVHMKTDGRPMNANGKCDFNNLMWDMHMVSAFLVLILDLYLSVHVSACVHNIYVKMQYIVDLFVCMVVYNASILTRHVPNCICTM